MNCVPNPSYKMSTQSEDIFETKPLEELKLRSKYIKADDMLAVYSSKNKGFLSEPSNAQQMYDKGNIFFLHQTLMGLLFFKVAVLWGFSLTCCVFYRFVCMLMVYRGLNPKRSLPHKPHPARNTSIELYFFDIVTSICNTRASIGQCSNT